MRISDWSSDVCSSDLVDKASQTLFRRYDDAASFGKENVDACVLSGTVFAKGVESVGQELMSIAQSAVEANIAATKALLGAKSVRELVDLQTEFSRSRFESLLAASAKLTELGLSLRSEEHTSELQSLMRISYAV